MRGNRTSAGVLVGAIAFLVVAAASVAAPRSVVLRSANYPALGSTILVDGSGRPLYHFVSEKGKTIRCIGSCTKTWPPLIVANGATATAAPGLNRAKLGTIKRPDGRRQATYGGLALYRYASDSKGTAGGQGLGKAWYVIGAPAGRIITKAVVAPPAADNGTSGGNTGGGTTGGGDTGETDPGDSYGYG